MFMDSDYNSNSDSETSSARGRRLRRSVSNHGSLLRENYNMDDVQSPDAEVFDSDNVFVEEDEDDIREVYCKLNPHYTGQNDDDDDDMDDDIFMVHCSINKK